MIAGLIAASISMTAYAATAQDIIAKNQGSYTAGTSSVYGSKLNQDQLNAVANVAADFATNYVNSSMDNDAKIRAGYNYIKNNVTYIDWRESTYANTAYGALVEKKAACSGMTRAFVALMDAVDVKAYWIHGSTNDHQWNLVEFNDGFYFIDIDANIASGFEAIYKSSTHPYAYDTAAYPAIGSHSGANTSGTQSSVTEGWKQDTSGWWYQNADGSYPANAWKQVNGKWYYFEANGYMAANKWINGTYYVGGDGAMLVNTTTPDGYQVGADGAWIQGAQTQMTNDGVHTKTFYDADWQLYDDIEQYQSVMDSNGNEYFILPETITSFKFLSNKSNLNPDNLQVTFTAYKYNPDTKTINVTSNDGTAIYDSFRYDSTYYFKLPNTNLTGSALVEYCKQNNIMIRVDVDGKNDGYGIHFLYCYK